MAKNRNRRGAHRRMTAPAAAATVTRASGSLSQHLLSTSSAYTVNGQRVTVADLFDDSKVSASAILARCINLIIGPVPALPAEVYTPKTGEPVPAHPVADLFNDSANPDMSGASLLSWAMANLCTPKGQAFVMVDLPGAGKGNLTPAGLYPLTGAVAPQFGTPTRQRPSGAPTAFKARVGDNEYTYDPSEILWFRHSGTSDPWQPKNPLRPAENALVLSHTAQEYLLNALRDGVSVGGLLHLGEQGDKDDTRKAALDAARTMNGKGNANRVVYTSGPTKPEWIPFGLSPVDMAIVEMLGISDLQVAQALGVPKDLALSESTYNNRAEARRELWENAIIPLLRIIEAEVGRRLLAGTGLRFRFDLSGVDALQESHDAKVTRATGMANSNSVLVDEVRETLDLDPLPGGAGQVIPAAFLANSTALTATGEGDGLDPVVRALLTVLQQRATPEAPAPVERAKFDPAKTVATWDRLEARGKKAVQALAAEQVEDVLNRLERTRKKGDEAAVLRALYDSTQDDTLTTRVGLFDLFDPKRWAERTRKALSPFVERVWAKGAEDGVARFEISVDQVGVLDERVHAQMEARLAVLADQVNETTAKAISEAILKPGVDEGDSIDALAKRLTDRFDQLSGHRAKTIARTETVGGYNSAHRLAAVESGVVTGRRWHAKIDNRTRDSHEHLHGHTIPNLDDAYPNGLMHPGDPSGASKETVNCRCVEEFLTD